MKHLRLFESFKKPYYEFNATEFYTVFKEIFNKEKEKNPDFSGDFFKLLDKLEYLSIPLDNTTETLIQNILQDKEVEFVDLAGDINTGRVKKTQFYYSFFFKKFSYAIDLYDSLTKYGYPEDPSEGNGTCRYSFQGTFEN